MRRESLLSEGSDGSFSIDGRPPARPRIRARRGTNSCNSRTSGRRFGLTRGGMLPSLGSMRRLPAVLVIALALVNVTAAGAQSLDQRAGLSPAVPVSPLALPNLAFDPSRLHFSMS